MGSPEVLINLEDEVDSSGAAFHSSVEASSVNRLDFLRDALAQAFMRLTAVVPVHRGCELLCLKPPQSRTQSNLCRCKRMKH